jgi:hypothetical protein
MNKHTKPITSWAVEGRPDNARYFSEAEARDGAKEIDEDFPPRVYATTDAPTHYYDWEVGTIRDPVEIRRRLDELPRARGEREGVSPSPPPIGRSAVEPTHRRTTKSSSAPSWGRLHFMTIQLAQGRTSFGTGSQVQILALRPAKSHVWHNLHLDRFSDQNKREALKPFATRVSLGSRLHF